MILQGLSEGSGSRSLQRGVSGRTGHGLSGKAGWHGLDAGIDQLRARDDVIVCAGGGVPREDDGSMAL